MKLIKSGLRLGILMNCVSAITLLIGNKVSAGTNTYPQLILGDHPVAYYRMEETTDATLIDSTTNQNGTYVFDTGPDGTFPELGQPGIDTNSVFLKFYTASDQTVHNGDIDIPFNPLLNPANPDGTGTPFSAEIWLQPTTQPDNYAVPFSEFGGYGSGIYGNASGWNFYQSPGPGSYWILNVHQAGIFAQATGVPIQLLNWYHLAVTFDGTSFVFYVNGVAQSTSPGTGYLANPGADEHIGTGVNVGFDPFNGSVDEAAIYTNALTATQILAHYQLGTNSFRAVNVAPSFLTQPVAETNYSGTPVTFTAIASGTTPISYQWLRGTNKIAGATNNTFSFTSHYPADDGAMFSVIATNVVGMTNSAVVTLSVQTNINIISAPFSVTRNIGSNSWAVFRVTANGALPLSYQWSDTSGSNPVNIPGATNDNYWVKGLFTNAQFSVVVSNPFLTNSPLAGNLNVQPRPVTVPITKYARVVVADSPVAYWRLDETNADGGTATDAVGSFDGIYTDSLVDTGPFFIFNQPTGIPHETDTAVGLTNGASIQIPFALELNPEVTWSAETWVQPYSLGANGNDYRVVLSSQFNEFPYAFNGWYIYQQPGANNFAFAPQPGNGFITANPNDPAHGNILVPFQWYHLVVTDDGTTFTVYINGQVATSFPVAGDQFIANGAGILPNGMIGQGGLDNGNTVIGQRTDAQFGTFIGTVDDTAFYNYALTPSQVSTHFANNAKVTVTEVGQKLVISWPFGTLQSSHTATGPYTAVVGATSPFTNSVSTTNTYYRVQTQ